MVEPDVAYLRKCICSGLVLSPCLELGVGYKGPNNKDLIEKSGIAYFGTDIMPGEFVNYEVDFEDSAESVERGVHHKKFGSILGLNILEHVFDPIRVLDNVFHILRPGGTCLIITPTVWPLHDYPRDCWRINPGFYEEYCKRRSFLMLREHFEYVGFHNVEKNIDGSGTYVLPSPSQGKFKTMVCRLIHRVFNTYGRGMLFPSHVATGVVIKKPE